VRIGTGTRARIRPKCVCVCVVRVMCAAYIYGKFNSCASVCVFIYIYINIYIHVLNMHTSTCTRFFPTCILFYRIRMTTFTRHWLIKNHTMEKKKLKWKIILFMYTSLRTLKTTRQVAAAAGPTLCERSH
jgi:hypothetical protein